MCLTPTLMLTFLSMISPEKFETSQSRIMIRAESGPVVYVVREGNWCIDEDYGKV